MKKVVITYNSKSGTTRKYSEEIGLYLGTKKNEVVVLSMKKYHSDILHNADYLLLGCRPSGLMFFLQHPEKSWIDFAAELPNPIKARTALFTTYKILTGSMFKKMEEHIYGSTNSPFTTFKSRNGLLSENDITVLDQFIYSKTIT